MRPPIQPPLVGEGAGVDGALEVIGWVVGVVGSAELPPLLHPTAKASTAAPPNSAIAVLAPDFIKRSILMSGRFLHTRIHFNYWIVATMLSWYSVTVPLSNDCQPTQCAREERDLVVSAMVAWGKRNGSRLLRPQCRGHRPASAAGQAGRTAYDVSGSRRAGARTYDSEGTHLAEKNARLREMVKSLGVRPGRADRPGHDGGPAPGGDRREAPGCHPGVSCHHPA